MIAGRTRGASFIFEIWSIGTKNLTPESNSFIYVLVLIGFNKCFFANRHYAGFNSSV